MRALAVMSLPSMLLAVASPAAAQRAQPADPEIFLINYQAQAKDAAAAAALSIFPGFGAGHFYADSFGSGLAVGGGELLGLSLFIIGSTAAESGSTGRDVLRALGAVVYLLFKFGDVTYAPFAADNYNVNLAMRLRVPIIGGNARGRGLDVEELRPTPKKPDIPRPPQPPQQPPAEGNGFHY